MGSKAARMQSRVYIVARTLESASFALCEAEGNEITMVRNWHIAFIRHRAHDGSSQA
jgi:hypothetical protein